MRKRSDLPKPSGNANFARNFKGVEVQAQSNVVTQVFEDFIAKLRADDKFDQSATERLRVSLLERNETDQDHLEKALFSEDWVE